MTTPEHRAPEGGNVCLQCGGDIGRGIPDRAPRYCSAPCERRRRPYAERNKHQCDKHERSTSEKTDD